MYKFIKIILIFTIISAVIIGYKHFNRFDYRQILDNSILQQKTFHADVVEIQSLKGFKAYLLRDTTNPIISFSFIFKGVGTAHEPDNQLGLTTILSSILLDGAGKYDSQNFKELLEENAITISYKTDLDDFYGELTFLKNKKNLATNLLTATLLQPHFNTADIDRNLEDLQAAQKSQLEKPAKFLELAFNKELYGTHPYARNPLGDKNTIRNITQKNLKEYLKTRFTRDNLIIGIAGDITEEEAKKLIDELFASLPPKPNNPSTTDSGPDFSSREKFIPRDIPQNLTNFAAPGVCRNDPDFYPLYILNHILGGSAMQSRLFKLAREDEGLTYGIYTYLSLNDDSCLIQGGFASSQDNMPKIISIVKDQWQAMREKGVTKAELQAAKDYLISSFNLRFAEIPDIAQQLALMQRQNLGLNFLKERNLLVQNVQLADVNRAAKVYFNPNQIVFVSTGKQ